ncbi:MAG: vWA domain-containing protein [Spirochaetia bacterium]|jgi:Mg-chelatase subunit ChlD
MSPSVTGAKGRARVALILVFFTGALLFGGGAAGAAQNLDLAVLVDTSESMFPYFDDLMNYLVQDLLTTRLHRGDTFHLISFSSLPEVEISLEVNSDQAARQAFSHVLLLHALGRYTDLVAAMQFLYKYVKELPETNPKQLIIITDGVHDPPPGSPNRGDPSTVKGAITSVAQAMRKEGWSVSILKVPPEPAPGEQNLQSYLGDIADALGVKIIPYPKRDKRNVIGFTTGYPTLIFPTALGNVGTSFSAPFKVKNWKTERIIVRLSSVQSEGTEMLERMVSVNAPAGAEVALDVPLKLPLSYPTGAHEAKVKLIFEDDIRISPIEGTLSFTYTGKGGLPIPRLTLLYVLYIVLGLAVLYLLIRLFLYMRKKLGEAPLSGLARTHGSEIRVERARRQVPLLGPVPSKSSAHRQVPLMDAHAAPTGARVRPTVMSVRRALPRPSIQQASLPPLIEMRVEQQNHRVGFRNVHRIAAGAARSVGGRFSSFLIFLVPTPSSIAEIRNVNGRYVFTPLRGELFPGMGAPVEDCLGREIPFVSPKGRELFLHFREWVSPLEEINRIMRSARSSGT